MGLRIFHRFRVASGVALNLSYRAASLSVGERGAQVTVGTSGGTETVGLPGTGVYWTERQGWGGGRPIPMWFVLGFVGGGR
jgi:hypothetical protein